MSFLVLCVCLFYCVFVPRASAQKDITFVIEAQNDTCNPSAKTVNLESGDSLTVAVTGEAPVTGVNCTTPSNELVLSKNDSVGDSSRRFKKNVTNIHNGTWTCSIFVKKGNENKHKVECVLQVHVKGPTSMLLQGDDDSSASDLILGMDPTTFYIVIGCVVGVLVIIIILIQTAVIIYYKSRISRRSELSHLEQRPQPRDDTARYSAMPMRKGSRSKRQSSGIYQSLENLRAVTKTPPPPNIKDRPKMPLPTFNESDDDEVYGGGKTLERIFAPEPPPIDSLPRQKGKKSKQKPKPKLPLKPKSSPVVHQQDNLDDMEDYDYADSDTHTSLSRQLIRKPMPIHSKPTKSESPQMASVRPSPTIPCMNTLSELDSVLKRRQLTTKAQEPVAPGPGIQLSSLPRRPPAPKENLPGPGLRGPPQDIRPTNTWTPPKPAQDSRPTQSPWSQGNLPSRYPQEDERASENSRHPEIRPQNVWQHQRPDPRPLVKRPDLVRAPQMAMVPPMQMMKSPPLPRKPGQVSDDKPPVPGTKRPLPPPPESESVYEPVAEGESSDDDEWKIEPLKPYNIYNI